MDKKIIVRTQDTKTFVSPVAAREYIKKLMDAGLLFLEISESEDDVYPEKPKKNPAVKPEKKVRGPYKKHVKEIKGKGGLKKKYTKEVLKFLRENCDTKDNKILARAVEDKFGFATTYNTVAWQMTHNKIKRKNGYKKKYLKDDGEEDLKRLPPYNDDLLSS